MPVHLSRRNFTHLLCLAAAHGSVQRRHTLLHAAFGGPSTQVFEHPGMLHSSADLERMREGVRRRSQPIYAGFEKLREDPHSQLSYKPEGASEQVGRNPTVRAGALESDSNAAYQMALMGHITGDRQFLERSAAILDDWSGTLKRITGADAILCAGLSPFKLINAAELLRADGQVWPEASVLRFGEFLRRVVLPVLDNFAAFANGNWDTAALKTLLTIAVFVEDEALFDRALVYYMHGCGDGRLDHYIYPNGQCQESGRDQQHTQLGLAHMGDCCEIAWHQGLDLYGMMEDRLLAGFEYTAQYEVGEEVPFVPDVDQTGKYRHQVISPRSPLRPVYEQIYNHYVMRRGLSAPWTTKAAAQVRPEGPGFGADHTGFGTLLYARPAGESMETISSRRPAGLYAAAADGAVRLSWVPLASPASYTVIRSGAKGTQRIPVEGTLPFIEDRSAARQKLYDYRVEATGSSRASRTVSAFSGMPAGWVLDHLGEEVQSKSAFCDGDIWRMSAGVAKTDVNGGLALLARPFFAEETAFSATLLPLFASQSLRAGIALMGDDERSAVLILVPGAGSSGEHVAWTVRLMTRSKPKSDFAVRGELLLQDPAVAYGRLYVPLGFRLRREKESWIAEVSTERSSWSKVGDCGVMHGNLRAGMLLTSGIPGIATEVQWREVTAGLSPGVSKGSKG